MYHVLVKLCLILTMLLALVILLFEELASSKPMARSAERDRFSCGGTEPVLGAVRRCSSDDVFAERSSAV